MNIPVSKRSIGILAAIGAITAIGLFAQQADTANTKPKDVLANRFQIIYYSGANADLLKLDTVTGETWHLQFASPESKAKGVYYVWTAIPTR